MTAKIIVFPRHHLAHCVDQDCLGNCALCAGLSLCTVCGGAEGSLPTDCPGTKMSTVLADEVYAGRVDFRFGIGWIHASNSERGVRSFGHRPR